MPATPFVAVEEGRVDDVAATVTSSAHDFVSWGTTRRGWREMGVRIDGDEHYGAAVLDAINII